MKASIKLITLSSLICCICIFFAQRYYANSHEPFLYNINKEEFIQMQDSYKFSQRVYDLYNLVVVLKKYKDDHGIYPISSKNGKGWDGLYSKYGESRTDWIKGLAPNYIAQLPRDPRNHTIDVEQYFYLSDGVNFKLISFHPTDCHTVKEKWPKLIDPRRGCGAYGFWTLNAWGH